VDLGAPFVAREVTQLGLGHIMVLLGGLEGFFTA
jgi:hypothetical protein